MLSRTITNKLLRRKIKIMTVTAITVRKPTKELGGINPVIILI